MPAPKPMSSTGSPGARRPASAASASAIGIEAAEVLPVVARMLAVRSSGMPSRAHGGGDDPHVGLVGHEQRDVVDADAGLLERPLGGVDHDPHGPAEHLLAVHLDGAADLGVEDVAQRAVGAEVEPEHPARAVAALEHDGAGAVTEEDGGAAVLPVHDPRHRLRSR